jgi:uncharacterized protein (DUF1499 family)
LLIALVALVVCVAAVGLGLRFYMSRDAEDRLRPGEDIALAGFAGPVPGNGALACPPGYCTAPGAIASPAFTVSKDRLIGYWRDLLAGEKRVTLLVRDNNGGRQIVLQRSALLDFPDVISVEFVSLGPDRSSLAIYSRARYGRSDFGVNRARIGRWLGSLEAMAQRGG